MVELPFELQKLPPSALDVLRYFNENGNDPADDIDIMDGADLSERSFSKAIKRLVTRSLAEMDGNRMYSLTKKGVALMEELIEYDSQTGGASGDASASEADDIDESEDAEEVEAPPSVTPVQRRMTLVVQEPLLAGQESTVYVGINEGLFSGSANLMVRMSLLNGEPTKQEELFTLANSAAYATFQVTAGEFNQIRLRVEAFQADDHSGELTSAGGMYVDLDVVANEDELGQLAAFGTDVTVLPA